MSSSDHKGSASNSTSRAEGAAREGRRRGVVLGLTIAEIILLILFAVVLAMSGVLLKRSAMIKAQVAAPQKEETPKVVVDPKILQIGLDFKRIFGDKTVEQVAAELALLQSELNKLKAEMAKMGNVEVPPPCYAKNNNGQTPYIFDIRIKNDGLVLFDTAPERLRAQLRTDMPIQPPLERPLSVSEFKSATNGYINYGRRNQCKFYVKVYDDTGSKDRVKNQLKVIESNFVWTFILTIKPGAQNPDDLNVFQTTPIK